MLEFRLSDHEPLRSANNNSEKGKELENNEEKLQSRSLLLFQAGFLRRRRGNGAMRWQKRWLCSGNPAPEAPGGCGAQLTPAPLTALTPVPSCCYESLYQAEIYVFPLLWKMMKLAVLGMLKSSFGWAMWLKKINPLLWKMFISLWHSLSLTSLVLNNITDGLLVKSLKDKSICYRGLFSFSSTMTPDHQGMERKAIKGATAATGYEPKPLDLPTLPHADAKSCTSCANFNFCGISFQAASTAHNVHEVDGCPGKRHPVLPESLAKLLCLAFQFFQLFLVLWRKYSVQEVKRRGTGSEVHLAKSVSF